MRDFLIKISTQLTTAEETKFSKNLLIDLPDNLSEADSVLSYSKRAFIAITYARTTQAYELSRRLQMALRNQSEDIKQQYEPIITWLTYAAIGSLPLGELIEFFRTGNIALIVQDDIYGDLINAVRRRLAAESVDARDSWREKIYGALHENDSLLTENAETQGQRGSISYWLHAYDGAVGIGPAETMERAEFENQADVQCKLSDASRVDLKRLLDFYEFIKLSSLEPEAFDEDTVVDLGGELHLLTGGKDIELTGKILMDRINAIKANNFISSTVITGQEPLTASQVAPGIAIPPLPDIINQARAVLSETNGDIKQILNKLYASVGARSVHQALAALLLLAQLRRLDDVLADDERFRALVSEDLKKAGLDAMLEGFRLNPTAPNFLARFLKIVLLEKLGLPESDALSFTQKIIPLLSLEGEKYGRILLNDGKGGLKWNL